MYPAKQHQQDSFLYFVMAKYCRGNTVDEVSVYLGICFQFVDLLQFFWRKLIYCIFLAFLSDIRRKLESIDRDIVEGDI